jgi:hypothetical protein
MNIMSEEKLLSTESTPNADSETKYYSLKEQAEITQKLREKQQSKDKEKA